MKGIPEELRRDLTKAMGSFFERSSHEAERKFQEGNKSLLLTTLFIHMGLNLPIPKWVRDAFLKAYSSQPEHWDDVFGRPGSKGRQLREEMLAYFEGNRLRAQGSPIGNDGFFDEIGKKIRKSGGTAKRRYYSEQKDIYDKLFAITRWFGLTQEEMLEHRDIVVAALLADWLNEMRDKDKVNSQKSAKD